MFLFILVLVGHLESKQAVPFRLLRATYLLPLTLSPFCSNVFFIFACFNNVIYHIKYDYCV